MRKVIRQVIMSCLDRYTTERETKYIFNPLTSDVHQKIIHTYLLSCAVQIN